MVLIYLFGSQNTSLTNLCLNDSQIGDAGASGIGAGLAYVSFVPLDKRPFPRHPTPFFVVDNGRYRGVFASYLQPKQDIEEILPLQKPNWRCWRCLDRWCLGVRQSFTL